PTTTTDRTISFELKSDVAIYGGFVATETQRLERDWETNITVLSGDIDNNDITDPHGVVTDTVNIIGDNSYHVVFANDTGDTTVLDGFTITAGSADGSNPHRQGGGVYNQSGDATLANLLFIGNQATSSGGGMYIHSGSPSLTNIIFNNNRATDNDWGRGGGLFILTGSSTLTHVQFINNQANRSGGGLVLFLSGSNPTLTHVVFHGNQAILGSGGGMYNDNGQYTLVDVHFINNSANWGGGLYAGGSFTNGSSVMTNVTFIGNQAANGGGGMANWWPDHVLTNVIFSGNRAGNFGGAIYNSSNIILTNVTFSGNKTDGEGGALYNEGQQILPTPWAVPHTHTADSETETNRPHTAEPSYQSTPTPTPPAERVDTTGSHSTNRQTETAAQTSSPIPTMTPVTNANPAYPEPGRASSAGINTTSPILQNVVFWNNEDSSGVGTAASSLVNVNGANPIIRHSLVHGCNPDGAWVTACGTNDEGNLADTDPLFIDPPDPAAAPTMAGNLRLQPASPAIDVGFNSYLPPDVTTDLDGNPRIIGPAVDLGAYESNNYLLNPQIEGLGTIDLLPEAATYEWGTVITATAVPHPGWHFIQWSGVISGTRNPITFTLTGHAVLTAAFANIPPTAVAGPPQAVEINQPVTLDGSGSSDSDPDQTLTYGWAQTGGPGVTLSDSTAVSPTFTAPAGRTILTFTLTVSNSWGTPSSPAEVGITVQEPGLAAALHPSSGLAGVGTPITYTLTITNSGDLLLSGLNVTSTLPLIFDLPPTLDPGIAAGYQATYIVQADDLPGPLVNAVWLTAVSPAGIPLLVEMTAVVTLTPAPIQHTLYLPLLRR
ncbi:MAG: choice-of-anchor Q domain-containing protein, partial [Chloroflexota bacterium]